MALSSQLEAKLKKIIADERAEAVKRLVGGLEDYPTYREEVGFIRCLDTFDDWVTEANEKIEEEGL
jgi:hypothetical protein